MGVLIKSLILRGVEGGAGILTKCKPGTYSQELASSCIECDPGIILTACFISRQVLSVVTEVQSANLVPLVRGILFQDQVPVNIAIFLMRISPRTRLYAAMTTACLVKVRKSTT